MVHHHHGRVVVTLLKLRVLRTLHIILVLDQCLLEELHVVLAILLLSQISCDTARCVSG